MNKSTIIFLSFFVYPLLAMDNDLNFKLYSAATNRTPNLDLIQTLIAAKADVNHFVYTKSLLHWIAIYGTEKACIILLEAGANPNTNVSQFGAVISTPLMAAIERKFIKASCLMIEKGANIYTRNSKGYSVLGRACGMNLPAVCKLLIEKQADINIQDKNSYTPLMMSIARWNNSICKLLLKNGADLHARTKHAETPLIIAARMHARDFTLAILNHSLFPSKTEAKYLMYSLARLRTQNSQIAILLYRQAKSLLAPWLLYGIATPNKAACINLLQMRALDNARAFEQCPVSLLNPECIDETIQSLIQNQLGNKEL
jgi:ankyrin repeat protein